MPILIAIITIAGAAWFWFNRARNARDAIHGIADLAGDAASAARRFSYKRRANEHPADGVDDVRVAGASLLYLAAIEDGALSQAEEHEILRQVQNGYGVMLDDARELLSLARWLADQRAPDEMIRRLVRKAVALGGRDDTARLVAMLEELKKTGNQSGVEDVQHRLAQALRR